MRRFWKLLVLTLAANFVAIAGGAAWLKYTNRLDREKLKQIGRILFPPPAPTQAPAVAAATTQPSLRLEELLARHAGKPPAEQLEYIRQSFDSRMAQLDRFHRSVLDLQRQVDLAQQQLARDRLVLESEKQKLLAREQEMQRLANDKGFQDTLGLYQTMSPKQVKSLFMGMPDDTVVQYLGAMESRNAARITKEFKTPEELNRLQRILDKLRQSQASATE